MPNSMVSSSGKAASAAQNQGFPPVDSILYSPLDDWTHISDYSGTDSYGLQNLFDESPLMSTLERQKTSDSKATSTPSATPSALSGSPSRAHTEIGGWEPAPEPKRTRPSKSDSKSACWTSPLCPAYGKPGPHPDPSTCGGGCGPNIFDDQSMDQWFESLGKTGSTDGAGLLETQITGFTTTSPEPVELALSEEAKSKITTPVKEEEEEEETGPRVSLKRKQKKGSAKRASSEESTTSPDPAPATKPAPAKPSRRQPHNEIEKKYRESINTHLEALKNSLPAFQQPKNQCLQGKGDIEDLAAAPKPSKSIILASAVAHIKKIEKEKRQIEQERNLLKQQVKALQALVKCDDCSLMQYVIRLNGLTLNNGPSNGCAGMPPRI
ncbi:uncharacterized protein PV09_08226 [Verruconis gallopava]|uniref:BHLH domain-containing protein n=1 Tax=Verruconis gallopava TaxID=253628 RepID=A0A0D2A1H7_9PEZI|nr:uncharacterized protein PV09_08226 [Verruconis gallopava]KIW00185.1 hypothetical protein PV09_08226 [Verruconis gallopava]